MRSFQFTFLPRSRRSTGLHKGSSLVLPFLSDDGGWAFSVCATGRRFSMTMRRVEPGVPLMLRREEETP